MKEAGGETHFHRDLDKRQGSTVAAPARARIAPAIARGRTRHIPRTSTTWAGNARSGNRSESVDVLKGVARLLLALALAACAASAASEISGRVLAGPTCPVQRIDSPCPDRPVAMALAVTDERGGVVARVTSDADGRFHLALAPGSYVIRSDGSRLPLLRPTPFVVVTGRVTELDLRADSGIR